MKRLDITGERYGRLVAIERLQGNVSPWRFKCDCGKETIVPLGRVRGGNTKSCGCLKMTEIGERMLVHGHSRDRQASRTLNQYNIAKQKCFNPRYKSYAKFGGRGISMCERWVESFVNFLTDMGECPEGLMLRRFNEEGDFEPGNCVWGPRR